MFAVIQQQTRTLNNKNMKKFLTFALLGLVLSVVFASCGSSQGGHCDAYGSIDQVENEDLAAL